MTTANLQVELFDERDEWIKARSLGLGSSDAPVILGLSKWKSPLSLYYEKRGMREQTRGETEFMEWGLALEPAIIRGYERITARDVAKPSELFPAVQDRTGVAHRFTLARDPDLSFLVASPDATILPVRIDPLTGVAEDGPVPPPPVLGALGILEVKNVDVSKGRLWDDAQEPPVEYLVQLQHQLMVTGLRWGSIAALVGGNRFLWADVARDEELIAMMRTLEIEFWKGVLNEQPPPVDGSESTKALLARLYPKDTGEEVVLPAEAREWDRQRVDAMVTINAAKEMQQEAENKIRAAIGDATMGTISDGLKYSWRFQTRKAHFVKESEFRVLRRHGGKGDD